MTDQSAETSEKPSRLHGLAEELVELRPKVRKGGGERRIGGQHSQGKKTARERSELLMDDGEPYVEIGMLVADDL